MTPICRFIVLIPVAMLSIFAAHTNEVNAASFNCSAKHSILEVIICADPELSALDSKEGEAYFQLKSIAPSERKTALLAEQRKFLQDRLRVCNIPFKPSLSDEETNQIITCFKGLYTLRIDKLEKEHGTYQIAPSTVIPLSTGQPLSQNSTTSLPQCDQSLIAKNYYVASCITHGIEITRKADGLSGARNQMNDARKQIDCSPDSLDRVQGAASSAAQRIISSGAISDLMDFGDAISIECNKAAKTALK